MSRNSSDSFIVEAFFKGQKDIFSSGKTSNENSQKSNNKELTKPYDNDDNQNGMKNTKNTKEEESQRYKIKSTEQHESTQGECGQEYHQNDKYSAQKNYHHIQSNSRRFSNKQDETQNYDDYNEIDQQDYLTQKLQLEDNNNDENKRALHTFKHLLQKNNHNIYPFSNTKQDGEDEEDEGDEKQIEQQEDDVDKEIVPFQQDISEIDNKYEQNYTYNIDNDNTEYILRNAEKYLDSPQYYQNNSKIQHYQQQQSFNEVNQKEEEEEEEEEEVEKQNETQISNELISQTQEQDNNEQINQMEETQDNDSISQIHFANKFKEQQQLYESGQIRGKSSENQSTHSPFNNKTYDQPNQSSNYQECSSFPSSESKAIYEKQQSRDQRVEEYERSIKNQNSAEKQAAAAATKMSSSDLKLKQRPSIPQKDQEEQQDIETFSSINQPYKDVTKSLLTPNKYASAVSSKQLNDNNEMRKGQRQQSNKDVKYDLQIALLESENKDLKQQIQQVLLENEALIVNIQRLDCKVESLREIITSFQEKISMAATIDDELTTNLELLQINNQQLDFQNEQHIQQAKVMNNQNSALLIENKNLLEAVKTMKVQNQYYQSKIEEELSTFNFQQTEFKQTMQSISEKVQFLKKSVTEYFISSKDLNDISKEVLKAYAPSKLQAKIDLKMNQIDLNQQSSQNDIFQSLDSLASQTIYMFSLKKNN